MEDSNDKQAVAAKYSRLSFILGIVSLAGLLCCFPLVPIVGGLGVIFGMMSVVGLIFGVVFIPSVGGMGIIFALISRGGDKEFKGEAKHGFIFSLIGTLVSVILIVGVAGYSGYYAYRELKTNDKIVDEMRENYELLFDNAGMEMPQEVDEMLKRMDELSKQLRNAD